MQILLFSLLSLLTFCKQLPVDYNEYVEPRIGTSKSITPTASLFGKGDAEKGQVIPAVLEPHGMNFWTPQTESTELKSIAPYYYYSDKIQGFRNSHWINGGCTQDYGSMTLMPLSGSLKCLPQDRASHFKHDREISKPYYYSVELEDYSILSEMTGTSRTGIFRFTYDKAGKGYLIVQPNSDEGEGYLEYDEVKNEIRGYNPIHRIYQGWGEPAGYSGYFIIKLGIPVNDFGAFKGDSIFKGEKFITKKKNIGLYIGYQVKKKEQFEVVVGTSFTGFEGARKNLGKEIGNRDFDQIKEQLHEKWNSYLSIVKVDDTDELNKKIFYSAMYRAAFLPHVISDCDGSYPAFAKGTPIIKSKDHEYYDDYSMWDTYRALHPLLNIIAPKQSADMINSLLDKYDEGGWLPIFPCWNSYTSEMIGDHCVSLIGDAYVKGIRNFDIKKAYKAMRQNAFDTPTDYKDYKNGLGRRSLDSYIKYGYIPLEDSVKEAFHQQEQVSRTLEYAYDDYVLSLLAKEWGFANDARILEKRALNYRNVIDPLTGYAQGRHSNGLFVNEYNAVKFCPFITEGTPCHYTWYVPHDIQGLVQIMGGRKEFALRLDSMFSEKRYWHGNEPCHQIPYLFNYIGEPWKTQKEVRNILKTEYVDSPGGLSGNDDAGQMSAWYIFSAMGFYPVCPGTPNYVLGSPLFKKVTLNLANGKKFTIVAPDVSSKNIYIQEVKWNGKKYNRNYITHNMILQGGILEFFMGDVPNKKWGCSVSSIPPSISK